MIVKTITAEEFTEAANSTSHGRLFSPAALLKIYNHCSKTAEFYFIPNIFDKFIELDEATLELYLTMGDITEAQYINHGATYNEYLLIEILDEVSE